MQSTYIQEFLRIQTVAVLLTDLIQADAIHNIWQQQELEGNPIGKETPS